MKKINIIAAITLTACSLWAGSVQASQQSVAAPQDVAAKIKEALAKSQPNADAPSSIVASPIPGVYEVLVGDQVFYADKTATYFIFNGQLVDLAKRLNITESRRNELLKVNLDDIDQKDAIIVRKGAPTAQRTLIVFSDPHCPFCHKLEAEIAKLDNIEIRTYLIPRPDAKQLAESIWCAKNQAKAWTDFMTMSIKPEVATCANPIEKNLALAAKYGIRGTPTLISLDARRSGGYRTAEGIDAFLSHKDR